MAARSLPVALVVLWVLRLGVADEPTAREVAFHVLVKAIELKLGSVGAVLCPQAGGLVLEFSGSAVHASNRHILHERFANWRTRWTAARWVSPPKTGAANRSA